MASRLILPFSDVGNGISPSDGAKLTFFEAGTSTPKDTFSNEALTNANDNPIDSDSKGLFSDIWVADGARYKVRLTDKDDNQQWESDPVVGALSPASVTRAFDVVAGMVASVALNVGDIVTTSGFTSAGDGGDNRYEIVPAGTGTDDNGSFIDLDTHQAKGVFVKNYITPEQFGAPANGTDDDAVATIAAIAFMPARGGILQLGAKTYVWDSTITLTKRVTIQGVGFTQSVGEDAPTRIFKSSSLDGDGIKVETNACQLLNFHFRGLSGNGGNGVTVEASRFVGRNLNITHMGKNGLRIGSDTGGTNSNYWRLDSVYNAANAEHGFLIDDVTPNVNVGTAINLLASGNLMDGIRVGQSNGCTWINCTAADNENVGLRFFNDAQSHIVMNGNYERNVTKDIDLDVDSHNIYLLNVRADYSDIVDSGDENFIIAADTVMDAARGHVSFEGTGGGTLLVHDQYNVPLVTKTATGEYTITIKKDMKDTNYTVMASAGDKSGSSNAFFANPGTMTAGTFTISVRNQAGTPTDVDYVSCVFFGKHV